MSIPTMTEQPWLEASPASEPSGYARPISAVSKLAIRITREHNRAVRVGNAIRRRGGVLIFMADGSLDRWESRDHLDYGPERIVYRAREHAVRLAEVQAWLDARA